LYSTAFVDHNAATGNYDCVLCAPGTSPNLRAVDVKDHVHKKHNVYLPGSAPSASGPGTNQFWDVACLTRKDNEHLAAVLMAERSVSAAAFEADADRVRALGGAVVSAANGDPKVTVTVKGDVTHVKLPVDPSHAGAPTAALVFKQIAAPPRHDYSVDELTAIKKKELVEMLAAYRMLRHQLETLPAVLRRLGVDPATV